MCGIAGYVGNKLSMPIVLNALSSLEYRGYDSAGIAVNEFGKIIIEKSEGKLGNLKSKVNNKLISSSCAIGHTRWATHGEPNKTNAHPHKDFGYNFAVVHNGIIENYNALKRKLKKENIKFYSDTDTEVVPHLLYLETKNKKITTNLMINALNNVVKQIKGSYALAILVKDLPDYIFIAKKQSPLIIGLGKNENFIASDVSALLSHTNNTIYLNDDEIGFITPNEIKIFNAHLKEVKFCVTKLTLQPEQVMLGNYKHFMEKEIDEGSKSIYETVKELQRNRTLHKIPVSVIKNCSSIHITACGTALNAGMIAKYILERDCRVPVFLDCASEFRYKNPIINENSLCIFISQSGETADTLACMELCKSKNAFCLAITNVVGSRITRLADFCIFTVAGPEIAVASTKAYVAQITALFCFVKAVARLNKKTLDYNEKDIIEVSKMLAEHDYKKELNDLVKKIKNKESVYFIGRGIDYFVALEAALKLKEISYIHCEAMAAGELKHGSLALITNNTVVIVILTQPDLIDKTLNAIYEIKSRGAFVVLFSQFKDCAKYVDYFVELKNTKASLMPLIASKPIQQLAYFTAIEKGNDPDKPRNLAKSVTVE